MTASFPNGFLWGAASSSYQVEGAWDTDGKGRSIWDDFCDVPGRVFGGHNGKTACDHIARMTEDVALMKHIGLNAYRFSVSWPRVMPDGEGKVSSAGLDFYDRLVDELVAAGIEPLLTLFHWDYPSALYRRGGWLNRDSSHWFAEYAQHLAERLADRVTYWMTLNEPQVFVAHGHVDKIHAPGLDLSEYDRSFVVHHALMAHGRAVQALRAAATRDLQIGWAPVGNIATPATPADEAAARKQTFESTRGDCWGNTIFADPVCLGTYPDEVLEWFDPSTVKPGDMEVIHQPIDFYGVNIYAGRPVQHDGNGSASALPFTDGHPQTAIRWWVTPDALYWGPKFLYERYKLPIIVTENGLSNIDWVDVEGRVRDPQRIDYTTRYLRELRRAIEDGVDIRGYCHWSIMDNFEWAEGYKERFGLIHVDFETGKRTPKDSAAWYRNVIATNGTSLG